MSSALTCLHLNILRAPSGGRGSAQLRLLSVDGDLPAVPLTEQTPQAFTHAFCSLRRWLPEVMQEKRMTARPPLDAAVLVPIVLREPTVLLTVRLPSSLATPARWHFRAANEILWMYRLRPRPCVKHTRKWGWRLRTSRCWGASDLCNGTAFHVTPVVALVRPQPSYFPNPGEVADLFECLCLTLLNPAHHERRVMQWQGMIASGLPCHIKMVSSSAISGELRPACCAILSFLSWLDEELW